jgi:archaellum component FlaC
MADEVKIKAPGSDLDDAVLQNAATEATLKKLVDALGGRGSGTGAKVADTAKKSAKGLEDLRKQSKNTENQFEKLQNRSKVLSQGIKDFGHSLMVTGRKFGDLVQPLASVMSKLNPSMAFFYGTMLALVNEVDRQVDVFRELSQQGADFGAGIFGSRMAAIEAGLSLDLFKEQVLANTGTFGLLGGSVNRGVRVFTNISKNIQKDFQPTLSRLGFTMLETSDYITDYLEIQTSLGKAQQMSQEDLTDGSKDYLLQLDMLSRVTGQSRKQLSEELKRQGQDLRLKSLMATMDKDAQSNLQAIVAGLGNVDPKLKSAIEEMIVTGGAPISDFGRMLASTSPELVNLAAGVRNGSVSSAEFAAGVRRAAAGANANRESLQGLATAAAITGNDMYLAQASLLSLTEYQSKASEATQEQMKAQKDATKAVTNFDSQMQKFRNSLLVLISPLLEVVGGALSTMSAAITGFTDLVQYLTSFLPDINIDLGKFGQYLKMAVGALMLLGLGYGSKKLGSAAISGAKGFMSRGGPRSTGDTGGGSKVLEGISKSGGGLGSGLKGMAAGLTAFANPTVLLGAAGLGVAITLVGAGLAAATWLIGGSLEKFADGLGKIAAIDGQNLKDVASGSMALSGAIASLGVSGVASGFASLFGGGSESFAKNINATLDSLDKGKIDSYTEALNSLGDSFAKVQNNMSSTVSATGKTSADKLEELNMTMKQVLYVLEGSKRYQRDTAAAVGEIT